MSHDYVGIWRSLSEEERGFLARLAKSLLPVEPSTTEIAAARALETKRLAIFFGGGYVITYGGEAAVNASKNDSDNTALEKLHDELWKRLENTRQRENKAKLPKDIRVLASRGDTLYEVINLIRKL